MRNICAKSVPYAFHRAICMLVIGGFFRDSPNLNNPRLITCSCLNLGAVFERRRLAADGETYTYTIPKYIYINCSCTRHAIVNAWYRNNSRLITWRAALQPRDRPLKRFKYLSPIQCKIRTGSWFSLDLLMWRARTMKCFWTLTCNTYRSTALITKGFLLSPAHKVRFPIW